MNEDFYEPAGHSAPRSGDRFSSRQHRHGGGGQNRKGRARRKIIDFWLAAEIFARRWHWLVVGGIVGSGLFFLLAWFKVLPRYTAVASVLRYETPGTSEFLKTTPLTSQTFSELLAAPELVRRVGASVTPPISMDELSRRVKVDPEEDSDVVKVYISASTPQEAVTLANLYINEATNYTSQLQAKQAAAVADTYLKEQVKQMDQDIGELTAQFRGMPQASHASNELAKAGNDLNNLSKNPALSPQTAYMITKLNEQLQSATVELNDLTTKYTDLHPKVIAEQQKIKELNKEIANAAGSTNTANAAAVIQASGDVVQPNLEVIRARLRSLEDARVELGNKEHEAQLYASNPPGMVRTFAPAQLKTVSTGHHHLKMLAVTAFGGGAGLVFGLFLVLVLEITDRRLRTVDDIQRVTRLPVLTTLGDLAEMGDSARTQWAFRTWTMLQGRLSSSQNHGLVCGVTSSTPGEGRSTCINMLAEAASLAGFRVLTIATRPTNTDVEPETSQRPDEEELNEEALNNDSEMNAKVNEAANGALSSSVLTTPSEVTDKLTDPNARPVVHIPLPGWVWNLERRKQWRDALKHWRQIENLVIFVELPPASVPESVLLGANLPNMLWLADSGKADAGETRAQLATLRNARCNLIGAVLNREPSKPFKSLFPRWMSCMVMFLALSLAATQAQTPSAPPTTTPAPTVQPSTTDTNDTLLSEPPPATPTEPETHLNFSVVGPEHRAEWEKNLTLGPGDVLAFSLYGDASVVRTDVTIGPDGRVNFLEAQDVLASGLTVDGLRQKMDDALSKYRRTPRTIIIPIAYNSKKYYVLGKVVQRGVYTLDRPTTVLEALARAKGIENGQVDYDVVDVADLGRSFLMRNNKRIPIDFEKLFESGDLSQNVQIEPGDYLYFPSADVKQVYVLGEVSLPGSVTYRPNLTMLGAISARGGFSEAAFKSKVLVVRGSLNHPETFITGLGTTADTMNDFKLQPNDIIYVTWRPFHRVEELADLAATAFVQAAVSGWVGQSIVTP